MRLIAAFMLVALPLVSAPVLAQETGQNTGAMSSGGTAGSMRDLLKQGFEIKAAGPKGTSYIVFLQKDQSAYACEFVTVAKTRCGVIN